MTRFTGIVVGLLIPFLAPGQGGDQQLRAKADVLFEEQHFAEALPMYSQIVSLSPSDRQLNYRFGTCLLFDGEDKEKAVSYLKYATEDPAIPAPAWYWLGRAYHLSYRFKEAEAAYQRFRGTGDNKALAAFPVENLEKQCRNGEQLLSNLKEITVRNKVEVDGSEFFRFYDLSDIGGRIVVLPEELKTSLDRKGKDYQLVYLPDRGGPIYFSSYGKDGKTGRDIYRTELMPDGKFSTPVKLAGYINTDLDEDFAFMHPDGRTFYFSSKGHNSMGGYDVFRSVYDPGLDAFGRPENMDFAVNTPDDDIFYMVDGEQKEACFASGRSSSQGKLHVYRVGTAQQPVIITIFKGTFASTIAKEDRKAHIVVEDAVTRERVADVRTDINGSYVLSLPRSGSFRYMVECGPSGKNHTGMVEVPKSDSPRAYRQELTLALNGDMEQLTIRNYFDAPLDDDLIALSLDEIRRRARLDITENAPVAEAPIPEKAPAADIMTRAGFTGDIDQAAAVRLASEDASELDREALDLEAQRDEAFAIAVEAASEADRTTAKALALVDSAANDTDEEQRNAQMVEAARARQHSREANLRARAAFRTGTELDNERLATLQKAATATRLSTELAASVAAKNDAQTLVHLTALKQRLDVKSGPGGAADPAEKARRAVAENEKAVARAMQLANTQRTDEGELTDRVARLKREQEETSSRSRKEELGRDITQLEEQRAALHAETNTAFAKAAVLEKETAALRGQASLTRHLSTTADHGPGAELNTDQVGALGLRITSTESRISGIPIDERYDAMLTATPAEVEARTFDWDLASAGSATGTERVATVAVDRDANGNAVQANSRTTSLQDGNTGDRTLETATVVAVPTPKNSGEERSGDVRSGGVDRVTEDSSTTPVNTGDRALEGAVATTVPTTGRDGGSDAAPVVTEAMTMPTQGSSATQAADDRFLLENERAELAQMIQVERDRTRRDSLQGRITELDQRLAIVDATTGENAAPPASSGIDAAEREELTSGSVDMDRPIVVFDANTDESVIVKELFTDYDKDKQRLLQLTDADERAAGLNGLELMLADSVRGEMARQVAVLDLAPQQAAQVLPRVDRLRQIREAHILEGERALQQRQDELIALAGADPSANATGASNDPPRIGYTRGEDPINDRFIVVATVPEEVYTSTVQHRATTVIDAVAFKDADIARMEDLTERVDSMEDVLAGMPEGRDFEKLRKEADQLIDERMIIRTDLGQRSAFLMKEEFRTANDSLKRVTTEVAKRGLPPNEPVLLLAQSLQGDAQHQFEQAAQMRKRADRIDDIVERDSLYRQAYTMELEALRGMDRAITVQNYLAGDDHTRGETLAYEPIASKVLGIALPSESTAGIAAGATQPMEGNEQVAVDPAQIASADTDRTVTVVPGSVQEATSTHQAAAVDSAQPTSEGGGVAVTVAPGVTAPALAGANTAQASAAAAEQARLAEARLTEEARRPLRLYENFLSGEGAVLPETLQDPEMEPRLLSLRAERAAQEASAMERRSVDLADQATLLADSAVNAKKRDREHLEQLATLTRAASDSLHTASLAKADEARLTVEKKREAEQAAAYRERLVKYYYLTSEEQALVMENADRSRYFQAKTRALEQYDAADEAANAAVSNREVGRMLKEQANASASAGLPPAEAAERAHVLNERASLLLERADSLDNVSARLRGAAAINENQASVLMQGMPAEVSTELMALEMRTRRNEPLLAEARSQAGAPHPAEGTQRGVEQPLAAIGGTADPAASPANNGTPVLAPGTLNEQAPSSQGGDTTTTALSAQAVVPVPTAVTPGQPITAPVAERTARDATTDPIVDASPLTPAASTTATPAVVSVSPSPEPAAAPAGVLLADVFELRPATSRRATAIAMDEPMPAGIVFKVQIGAFRSAVPQEAFSDMSPVTGETVGNGLTRYTAGMFVGFDGAASAKDQVRDRGYRDAFVVAYRDGRRVPLGEAMREARAAQPTAQGAADRPVVSEVQPIAIQPTATIQAPAPVAPAVAQEDIASVLASYPATAEEVIARFTATPEAAAYYDVPGAAPARQVETVKGLFFTVQVGVYSKPVPLDKLFNITPLNSERTETAKVRYTTGMFFEVEKARVRKDEAVSLGVKDAFITAYLNGKRIPMREANALLEKFGPAILAKP
ncbi:MAG: hypothetical protein ABI432_09990 [Flavobacteriales bacterium]